MANFYANGSYISCGNGCNAKMQSSILDENNYPGETDWNELQRIYNDHNAVCTPQNPYTTHSEAFYGNPDDCFQYEGRFCKY